MEGLSASYSVAEMTGSTMKGPEPEPEQSSELPVSITSFEVGVISDGS